MRFAMSNIAWSFADRKHAYARLQAAGFSGLEIAPGIFFANCDDPFKPTKFEIAAARAEIADAELELVSMQSVLFGLEDASLFGEKTKREAFQNGIYRAIALAGQLEIRNLVLGSPKQRNRPVDMDLQTAMNRAVEILSPLADAAKSVGCAIAIECSPVAYGSNFLTTPQETLRFVNLAAHNAITLNFDVGATLLTGTFEHVEELLEAAGPVISHVHISEPFLSPAPANPVTALRILSKLAAMGYNKVVSIEMRQTKESIVAIENALGRLNEVRCLLEGKR